MSTSPAITLAALLRRFRVAAGLTQDELAERAKLSVRAIGDLERGVRRAPHKDTLALLIEAMGLGTEEAARLRDAARHARSPRVAATPATAVDLSSAPPTSFPDSLTPLIGREREEAAIAHLLGSGDIRLLTLTGRHRQDAAGPAGRGASAWHLP